MRSLIIVTNVQCMSTIIKLITIVIQQLLNMVLFYINVIECARELSSIGCI